MIRKTPVSLIFTFILIFYSAAAFPQSDPPANFENLADQERWQEIIALAESAPDRTADVDYYYGLALARLQQWDKAREALLAGRGLAPHDKRFPIELAGVDFIQKKYARAARYLRRALRLDPHDSYANDFLGTVYFLEGNLQAALKYWNRVDKPQLDQVRREHTLRVSPVLLDHALVFSPAGTLKLQELVASEGRIEGLEIFPMFRFELAAVQEGNFDLTFHATERNGLGNSRLERLLTVFRGLPYQQVDPEYFNFRGHAINFVSMLRWDAEKRRASGSVSGPLRDDPRWRYRFTADLRNENWDVRNSFSGPAPVLASLNLLREGVSGEITRFFGTHHSWSLGAELSHRDYRDVAAGTALSPQLVAKGFALKQSAALNYEVWRFPERRLTVNSCLLSQVARIWSTPAQSFARVQGCAESRWFPLAQGDDFATNWRVRAGRTFGDVPFDELFVLGLERDNDLWLRAHIGTRGGRKGSAPLGRDYFLSNWETDKELYRNGIIAFKLGPFVDTGKINDSSTALGSHEWLWDAGVQAKISVFGVGVAVSYGKDLRTGRNAVYTTLVR